MADDNLLLEILRSLQAGQAELRRELAAMRADLSLQLDAIRQHQVGAHADDLAQRQALDERATARSQGFLQLRANCPSAPPALRQRVERIERRLEIAD